MMQKYTDHHFVHVAPRESAGVGASMAQEDCARLERVWELARVSRREVQCKSSSVQIKPVFASGE
jgi:hypothetical protein